MIRYAIRKPYSNEDLRYYSIDGGFDSIDILDCIGVITSLLAIIGSIIEFLIVIYFGNHV